MNSLGSSLQIILILHTLILPGIIGKNIQRIEVCFLVYITQPKLKGMYQYSNEKFGSKYEIEVFNCSYLRSVRQVIHLINKKIS